MKWKTISLGRVYHWVCGVSRNIFEIFLKLSLSRKLSGPSRTVQAGLMDTSSRAVPAREMERMMKLQDVILKALAKKLTWTEAAEIASMSVRNMQRKRQA